MKLVLKTIVPVLGLLLLVPACGPSSEEDSHGAAVDAPLQIGTVWRWTALSGSDALEVDGSWRYTLEFLSSGRYVLRADCNKGSGPYTLDGNELTLGPGPMTMAACGPDSLGERYAALLGKTVRLAMEGEQLVLELGEDAGSMLFEASQPISLVGTSWLVRGYNNGRGGVQSVAAGSVIHVEFTEDGVVCGSAGCNTYTGSYEIVGDTITPGPAAATRKMCAGEGVMEQEAAFLEALASAAAWEIDGERLKLRTALDSLALDLVSAVSGTVTYRVRKALHPESRIHVSLQDVSRADAPAKLIAEQVIQTAGKQVPIPFEISFDPAAIDPRMTYAVRATIQLEGKMIMTSTQSHPVITRDAPRYDVEIQLDPVGD